MTADELTKRILLSIASGDDIRLFRNPTGFGWVGSKISHCSNGMAMIYGARAIRFGLHEGSSDLIGWKTVTITPDMVGRKVAIFLGVEVKTENDEMRANQKTWDKIVRQFGGISVIARTANADELRKLMGI